MNVDELERELKNMVLPKEHRLDQATLILDTSKFIESHLTVLRENKGKKSFLPYYSRLIKFYNQITPSNNGETTKN